MASLTEAAQVRRTLVQVAATVTSKGQVTIPKSVRDALGLAAGTRWCFGSRGSGRRWRGRRSCWSWLGR